MYIDNITIFSPSMKQHLIDWRDLFERLQKTNLKLNFEKCNFALPKVKVLGHLVSWKGIQPDPKKVEIIRNLPPPQRCKGSEKFYKEDKLI